MGFSFSLDLASFIYGKLNPHEQRKETDSLSMSVIIPAYNEGANLEKVVDAQYRQTKKPKNVVVINDKSTDNTHEVCEYLQRRYPSFIYVNNEINKGKAEGINSVIRNYYSELGEVAYINDGDGIPEPNCLEEIARGFGDEKVAAVTGFPKLIAGGSLPSKLMTYGKQWQIGVLRWRKHGQAARNGMFVLCGATMAIKKDVLRKIPMPTRTMTEDLDYTWMLERAGYKLRFQEKAICNSYDVTDMKAHWNQTRRWHKGAWQALYSHGKNLKKEAKGLFYTTLVPTWLESVLFLGKMATVPFLYSYSPALLGGLAALSFGIDVGITLASKPSYIKYLPASLLYTGMCLASQIISFAEVTSQKLRHQTYKWKNKWDKKAEGAKGCQK